MNTLYVLAHGVSHGGPSTWDIAIELLTALGAIALGALLSWGSAWLFREVRRG